MTVHKLSAGDGYTYLTRQVASGDHVRSRGEGLADYYVVDGQPPGVWLGSGLDGLGVSGRVHESQMKALFGEGRHPDSDRIQREGVVAGLSPKQALEATKLGRAYPQYKAPDEDVYRVLLEAGYSQFRKDYGRNPEPGVERDLIKWNVAGQILGPEASDKDRSVFLADRGRSPHQAVAGYDLVFTPAKSVSVLWALGDAETHEVVAQCHERAWRDVVGWIEDEAALTRVGAGGIAQLDTKGFLATAFRHHDSRAGDPNLHTHVAIANKVQGEDGKWRAIDARVLYSLGVAASERYNSQIEAELSAALGVRFVDVERGRKQPVREIDGIHADVIGTFSSRRESIEDAYKALVAEFRAKHGHEPSNRTQIQLMQQANLDTRQAKSAPKKLSQQREEWQQQAATVLGQSERVDQMIAGALDPQVSHSTLVIDVGERQVNLKELTVPELGSLAVEIVAENRSTWTRWNIEAQAQRLARQKAVLNPDLGTVQDLSAQITKAATAESMIRIEAPDLNPVPYVMRRVDGASIYRVHGGDRFTSQSILTAEDNLLQAARTRGGMSVSEHSFTTALRAVEADSGHELNEGQRRLAYEFARKGTLVVAGIGPAGSGKTSASMRVFVEAVKAEGKTVIALGPSAASAAVLGDELGVRGETIHKLLIAHSGGEDDVPAKYRIDAGTVLLVDEAGMAGTPRLSRLVDLARKHGASVRLLGDPKQLTAVEAGGALRLIANRVGAVELTEVHRFKDPEEAKASLLLRDGDPRSLDYYIENHRVKAGSRDGLIEDLYADWSADIDEGLQSLMIAGSNQDVAVLNTRARLRLVEAGVVTEHGRGLHDDTKVGIGDRIVTRTNNRKLLPNGDRRGDWVRNGDVWDVTDLSDDGSITVKHTTGGHVVQLPATYVDDNVELAYATTVNRAQGMTVDRAHMLVEQGTTREQLYVGTTRGRDTNRMYAVTEHLLDLDVDHKPALERAAKDVLEAILGYESAEKSGHETIEDTLNEAVSLSKLVPEYEDARDRILNPDRIKNMEAAVHETLDDLNPELATEITNDPAWTVFAARLAQYQSNGIDLGNLLINTINQRELDTAHSVAQVLYWRMGPPPNTNTDTRLPKWVTPPPPTDNETNPEVAQWIDRQADLIADRIHYLVDQTEHGKTPWAHHLPPAPTHNPTAYKQWRQQTATIAAYRDQYTITDTKTPLGEQPKHGHQLEHYQTAEKALTDMQNAARTEPTTGRSEQIEELSRKTAELSEQLKVGAAQRAQIASQLDQIRQRRAASLEQDEYHRRREQLRDEERDGPQRGPSL